MVVNCHLEDEGIARFLFVSAQSMKDFQMIIGTVQSQDMQDFLELSGSKPPFKGLGRIMMVLMCFSVCIPGQLSSFTGSMMCGQVSSE